MTDVSEVGLAHVAVGAGLVGLVLVGLTAGLVGLGDLPLWRAAVTAAIVLGIPNVWGTLALQLTLEVRRGPLVNTTDGDWPDVIYLLGPVVLPIHLAFALDPFVGTALFDGNGILGEYAALVPVAMVVQLGQLYLSVALFAVVKPLTPVVGRLTGATAERLGVSASSDSDAGYQQLLDRLADSRLWATETVTADRASLDCDRCDRRAVAGVRRTTIGGVAGYPLRETTEDICRECQTTGDRGNHGDHDGHDDHDGHSDQGA